MRIFFVRRRLWPKMRYPKLLSPQRQPFPPARTLTICHAHMVLLLKTESFQPIRKLNISTYPELPVLCPRNPALPYLARRHLGIRITYTAFFKPLFAHILRRKIILSLLIDTLWRYQPVL